MLAILCIERTRSAPMEAIRDVLWTEPPRTWRNGLHNVKRSLNIWLRQTMQTREFKVLAKQTLWNAAATFELEGAPVCCDIHEISQLTEELPHDDLDGQIAGIETAKRLLDLVPSDLMALPSTDSAIFNKLIPQYRRAGIVAVVLLLRSGHFAKARNLVQQFIEDENPALGQLEQQFHHVLKEYLQDNTEAASLRLSAIRQDLYDLGLDFPSHWISLHHAILNGDAREISSCLYAMAMRWSPSTPRLL